MSNLVPSEDLFIDLFSDVFGVDKTALLYPQYEFVDIYNNTRYADFVVDSGSKRIAIEIDGEAVHNKNIVSNDKFDDDQLKQNSMINYGWDVYRWSYRKLTKSPDTVKDEMQLFLGSNPNLAMVNDYLPSQQGEIFQLREHQAEALANLKRMREEHKTIALVTHATGTGKTITAIMDAKQVGGRVLFIAHTKELVKQPLYAFKEHNPDKTVGMYVDGLKEKDCNIVCGSVQSVALNLEDFMPTEFDYIIIDEAHHASSESYQKIISYFKPKFLLGLTATPERADNQDIMATFQSVAHKLDIKTAVEIGQLVPVRCFRIKTNIDISNVRFNGIKYNAQDLENKLFVPERNKLIVDTYLNYGKNSHSVIFCVSVKHAEEIATMLQNAGTKAMAVSGNMSSSERKEILASYEQGKIDVLCACDLLNEGWDSPKTNMLFMARPTMSKVLYTQQLGRGMRMADNKESLIVFDFVDNSNMFNSAYSLHKMFGENKYREGGLVLANKSQMQADEELYRRGERPEALIDYPISTMDIEYIDIFNWQKQAEGMLSQMAFIRMVDVQSETIEKYIRDGKIVADLTVPTSSSRVFRYFKEETIKSYAEQFGWQIITDDIKKDLFMDYIRQMDMSYSYKPVLMLAILEYIDDKGRIKLEDIVNFFINFYADRKSKGLTIEKKNSIYCKSTFTKKEVERNILLNPFKRFEDMNMLFHTKTLGIVQLEKAIHKKLTNEEINFIKKVCENKLKEYYERIKSV